MTVSHPVARTAFYCCMLRADDAAAAHPVCGDAFAARFLDDGIRRELEPLLRFRGPTVSNVARHHLIDDLIRARLARDPDRRVLVLGAGFDTRAFRLRGGRWWEIDEAELLAFKEQRLPAGEAPNPLARVPVAFEKDELARALAPLAGDDPALVVVEGVTMYLADETLATLASTVRAALPNAALVADLMTPGFARTFSRSLRRELTRLGARFAHRRRHPRHVIEAAGYVPRERHSIAGRAREAGAFPIPGWIFHTVFRGLRDGYAVWVFEPGSPSGR